LVGFETLKAEFADESISVFAASVDDKEHAQEVQNDVSFPVAHGVTREQADTIGAWWDAKRNIIQPSEFVLDGSGKVISASYSTGPIGRVDAADVLKLIGFLKSQAKG